jgi:hypothetical protein
MLLLLLLLMQLLIVIGDSSCCRAYQVVVSIYLQIVIVRVGAVVALI